MTAHPKRKKSGHHNHARQDQNDATDASGSPTKRRSSKSHHHSHDPKDRDEPTCEFCRSSIKTNDTADDGSLDDDVFDINCATSMVAFEVRKNHLTSFYIQSTQCQGTIAHLLRASIGTPTFTEEMLSGDTTTVGVGPQLRALFTTMSKATVDTINPTCPFVMMLSALIPSLRKFLQWVIASKGTRSSSFSSISPLMIQLTLHNILMDIVQHSNRFSQLMGENEDRNRDISALTAQMVRLGTATPRPLVSSSSCSSLCSNSSSSRPNSPSRNYNSNTHLPQVKKITLEFESLLAAFKYELAELTESTLDATESIITRLVTSTGNEKMPSTEYVNSLCKQVLEPIRERTIMGPTSRMYLFPRIVDRSIYCFLRANVIYRPTPIDIEIFGNACKQLKKWCSITEEELINRKSMTTPREPPCRLLELDTFRRMDHIIQLYSDVDGSKINADPSRTNSNWENLRLTLKRAMSGRRTESPFQDNVT